MRARVNKGWAAQRILLVAHLVLVVDDDLTVLEVLAEMLEDLGCEVISANGGCDALKKLSDNDRISILITDLNMPAMDGHELAERAETHQARAENTTAIRPGAATRWLSDDQKAVLGGRLGPRDATNDRRLLTPFHRP